jgi:hypothetical protein
MHMHALLVTFDSAASPVDLEQPFTEFAHALKERDGFIMKTWLSRDSMLGGFYVFSDQESAERYLEEMLIPAIGANEAFTNLQIQHFGILDALSVETNTPTLSSVPD